MQSRLQFEHGALAAVFMRWGLDPMFSSSIRGEFDKNHDGKFDPAETRAVEAGAFVNLRNYGFFTHLDVSGSPVELKGYRDFAVHMEGEAVVYEFVLPLPRPVRPGKAPIKLGVYDDTYYIDLEFSNEDPVTFAGEGVLCKAGVAEDATTAIYYGMVNPLAATVTCDAY